MSKLNKYEKAILDIIAYAEGTMLYGDNNGYDILFGGYKIVGWSENTDINHRCDLSSKCVDTSWKIKIGTNKDGQEINTTAAGRYQVVGSTWAEITRSLKLGDNAPLTINNQNLVAQTLLKRRKVTENDLVKASKSLEGFKELSNKIKLEWQAFEKSLNNNKNTPTQEELFEKYKQVLEKY
jgi:muramidase (phage lysozyme)